jgi:ATP-dependent helicase HrpB
LLDSELNGEGQIVVLEPRRLAARAAAGFVARERGWRLGGQVGYRVRYETCGGADTRLWYLTEGILGRQLTGDPFLERIAVVILDEFHERHLPGDVALAVVRELQESVRPDLKLVVMSATLETERLAAYLGDCPVLTSDSRQHPIAIEYRDGSGPLWRQAVAATQECLAAPGDDGDVLVFLPGAAEIRRAAGELAPLAKARGVEVAWLHGDLPLDQQQRVLQRGPRRKVVLSTNVAETSLTIEGVTTVVDTGVARAARYDAARGINTLALVPISRAAAAQRAGRAGRLRAGRCVRVGRESEYLQRRAFETPEVQRLDLAGVILELRAWGVHDLASFGWLDPPSAGMVARAETLLRWLGAVEESGGVTDVGRRMLALPVEPRLSRCLVEAQRWGCVGDVALLVALISEREILLEERALEATGSSRWGSGPSDLLLRADLLCRAAAAEFDTGICQRLGIEKRAARAVDRARRQLLRVLRVTDAGLQPVSADGPALSCLLAGYPDRVCRRRQDGSARALMVGGSGVVLSPSSIVRDPLLFLALAVEGGRDRPEAIVRLASAIEPDALERMFPLALRRVAEPQFDPQGERVVWVERSLFHDLELTRRATAHVDPQAAGALLSQVARQQPERALSIGAEVEQLLGRIAFLREQLPQLGWPGDRRELLAEVAAVLALGRSSFAEMRRCDVVSAVCARLTHQQRQALERDAPAQIRLPSGRSVRINYKAGTPPYAEARVQELFGQVGTPRLAGQRVPLVLHILAPNSRPVQVTDDLESFWSGTYPEIRKVLRGRYPKHDWPEDPLRSLPSAGPKRRVS